MAWPPSPLPDREAPQDEAEHQPEEWSSPGRTGGGADIGHIGDNEHHRRDGCQTGDPPPASAGPFRLALCVMSIRMTAMIGMG